MTILSIRFWLAICALVAGGAGFTLGFGLGGEGLGTSPELSGAFVMVSGCSSQLTTLVPLDADFGRLWTRFTLILLGREGLGRGFQHSCKNRIAGIVEGLCHGITFLC